MDIKQIHEEFQGAVKDLTALVEKQSAEIKEHGQTTGQTAGAIKKAEERLENVTNDLKEIQAKHGEDQKRLEELEKKLQRPDYSGAGEPPQSIGRQFVESEQYKAMLKSGSRTSSPMWVPGLFATGVKALTSDPASAGVLVQPYRYPQVIEPAGQRALRIRDLLNVQTTESNAIEFVRETGFTDYETQTKRFGAAKPVAEGAKKPRAKLAFELKTEAIKTIAHWIPASRQILDDAAQLRSYVDQRLIYGVKIEEEAQILYGNGVSPNLQGIMTDGDVQTYAWSDGEVGDTRIDAVRRAMTLAQLAEYPVTGVVLHPTDWEHIELAKGDDGHYIWVVVTEGGQQRLWRVPVVDTMAINEGEFLAGAFGLGAWLWDRQQASIRVAEQHGEFFIQNMVAILAEERLALTMFRPEAFVVGTFDAPPAS